MIMADLKKILNSIIDVGKLVVPVVGGPGAAAALKAIDSLLDAGKSIAGPDDKETLEELQARVNAHADKVISSLRGT
jgi:putative intracellular protease/amidase